MIQHPPTQFDLYVWEIRLELRKIIKDKDLNSEQKKRKISYSIINLLEKIWLFYKTKQLNFYYFDNFEKKIFKIKSDEFKFLLNQYFEINGSTDYYKYLIEDISSHISTYGKEVNIYDFSYYDLQTNTLYVYNNWVKIIKITKDTIEEVENWYNWIIFDKKIINEEWNLVKNLNLNWHFEKLREIIKNINFDTDSNISKNDYIFILENYIYSLFFPNILNTRPILAFIWNKWSWKSFFLKLLLYIFYGKESSLSNLPANDEEFKNSLMNNYLYFIDNLDDSITKTKIDILCSVATWIWIKKRVLYTDNTELNFKVNSFLAITSRTPKFKRVDLNERLLIIKLMSLEKYISETELFSKINRDEMMTYIVYNLHKLLQNIDSMKYYTSNFRIADFANLILNLRIQNKSESEIKEILELFTREQEEFSLETDPLIDLLEMIVNDKQNHQKVLSFTSNELHRTLREFSTSTFSPWWERIPYSIKSPIALWKKLSEIQKWLSHKFKFRIEKGSSNIKNYIFENPYEISSPHTSLDWI